MSKTKKNQFGDFQTPPDLAQQALTLIARIYGKNSPELIIEPSCGKGVFAFASQQLFPKATIIASDINADYIAQAISQQASEKKDTIEFSVNDFFSRDWDTLFSNYPTSSVLILGNPPWVTNSELGEINSQNLPNKSNFQKRDGLQALLGSANFDISEYMLLQYLKWIENRQGMVAVLCKLSVARKIFRQQNFHFNFAIYQFDAKQYFGISVEACLLIVDNRQIQMVKKLIDCSVYADFKATKPSYFIGTRNGILLNNIAKFSCNERLLNKTTNDFEWRSGIKHDCAKVMELTNSDTTLTNGFDEPVNIEKALVFPLLKSSDIANGRINKPRKSVLITQEFVGQDTQRIKDFAPKTWAYLEQHMALLNARKSSIYKGKPPFSIFGVGDYTFKPWKIAISSMYKSLNFQLVAPFHDKPIIFDDTVNFLSFSHYDNAKLVFDLLTNQSAKDFFESMIFYDDKRPITVEVLKRLSLENLAQQQGLINDYHDLLNSELNAKVKV